MSARAIVLRLLGRPVRCSECGGVLFRGIVFVRRGRVRLIGASANTVRVRFSTTTSLEFRHVHLDSCPTPERPWVPRS